MPVVTFLFLCVVVTESIDGFGDEVSGEEEGIRGIHPSLRESQGSRDVTETIDQFADELTLSFQPPVFGPFSTH